MFPFLVKCLYIYHMDLKTFFKNRPAVSARKVALESGISPQLMLYILAGKRKLTEKVKNKLEPNLCKYGWKKGDS